jgi:VWFA-related protein
VTKGSGFVRLLFLGSAIASAQEPAPPPTFRGGVQFVQVSVIASDKRGKPVADLRREDFQLLDNGSPREIRLFLTEQEKPTLAAPERKAPGTFTNQIASVGSHSGLSIILIDTLFTDFDDTVKGSGVANARLSALQALRAIPEREKVAIYSLGRKLQVVCDFTSDRNLLERQLGLFSPNADTPDTANEVLFSPLGEWIKDHRGDAPEEALIPTLRGDALQRGAVNRDELELLGDRLAGVPGRKNLIWLSNRFVIGSQALLKFNANVAIYPVDVAGVCRFCGPRPMLLMDAIARLTGGVAYHGRNDLDAVIREAMDDGRVSYMLGFYRSDDESASAVHRIGVRVSRPGVSVRYRTTYQTETSPPIAADRRPDLAQALNGPLDATGIPVRALAQRVLNRLNLHAVLDTASLGLVENGGYWTGQG